MQASRGCTIEAAVQAVRFANRLSGQSDKRACPSTHAMGHLECRFCDQRPPRTIPPHSSSMLARAIRSGKPRFKA